VTQAVIIDSGGANLASLGYALQRLGVGSSVSCDASVIRQASHVLLPGVGTAGNAMARLCETGLDKLIPELTQPVLGICLGMQLLFTHSEEDGSRCLGVIDGTVRKLLPAPARPVPHMGWNTLHLLGADPLLDGFIGGEYVYFVHSYFAAVSTESLASSDYGLPLSATVRRNNFCGVQFHPERSGASGSRLLANFLRG
jgi:imidazole glycerol-phosphate synthase subunit HisH